ncbi:glycosyltransferase involved in cell wall biosynthesis [Dongia mobilis]|uniref:Glycosyltransferase involved in cell wall biosynthesis n=1 Tax=Dongia mobilis TaxID=578943 RepID=A0A4R6WUZ1_9PROT|nr:glycosyl transferase family 2 [Dongia mobilis]TDQ83106.1 glycosyltransferase involved in cell wall biosynthesis [Dongia mobilis]
MKIAVYTIALNEEKFASRWAQSCADADYRIVADTGSLDSTVPALRAEGVTVHSIGIRPWRFDHARNANLALVPIDAEVCISLDMDEILMPGWRAALEQAWTPGTTRLRYTYVWNWDAEGRPKVQFFGDKIHHRHGYFWKHPAHEVILPQRGTTERVVWAEDVRIHHHADDGKSRGQYLDLLALATAEDPDDDRSAHYFGRELMFHKKYEEAIVELRRHLSLPRATWKAERAASLRFIGRCHKEMGRFDEARGALLQACAEAPDAREPWFEFAKFCMETRDWAGGVWAAHRMLALTTMPRDHTRDVAAWGVGPYDVGSVCAYYNGQRELAREWLRRALEYEPDNARLAKNGEWIFAEG